jgi:hypothetical protein
MLDLNNKLVHLTNKSLDENATVRIVTLVTLIYLPASFVSVSKPLVVPAQLTMRHTPLTDHDIIMKTLFGMNFFDFGEDGNLEISHHFWIFIILAVPLTVVTVGSWYWLVRRRKKLRERQRAVDAEQVQ